MLNALADHYITIMTTNNTTNESEKPTQNIETEENVQNTATEEQVTDEEKTSDADKLAAAEEEIATLKDKYLRQVAEFDNYRKRTLKEKVELIQNGGEKVLSALLPVLDDLDRALDNINKSDDVATLKEGVELIIDKMYKTLASQGLKKMETIGQEFDTDFHEAVALIPATEEVQKNHVMDCVQAGYLLGEKVIRHAKVVVGQ